jgi:transposase
MLYIKLIYKLIKSQLIDAVLLNERNRNAHNLLSHIFVLRRVLMSCKTIEKLLSHEAEVTHLKHNVYVHKFV